MSIKRLVPLNLPVLDNLPSGNRRKGDLVYYTGDDNVYVFDGSGWVVSSGSGSGVVSFTPSAPPNPVDGQIWVDSDSDVPTAISPHTLDGGSPSSSFVPGATVDGGSP